MALGAVALLVILFFGHLCLGSVTLLSPLDVISELFGGRPQGQADPIGYLVWEIRLPRALAALLVGGALAVAGATFQSLFRNPSQTHSSSASAARRQSAVRSRAFCHRPFLQGRLAWPWPSHLR